MKLDFLPATTKPAAQSGKGLRRPAPAHGIREVEALDTSVSDRERSLQQELSEISPAAVGPFSGEEFIRENARKIARQITLLGPEAAHLVRPTVSHSLDDKA